MKKFFVIALLILMPMCLFGCSQDLVAQASKDANTYQIIATLDDENKTLTATETLTYKNNSQNTMEYLMFHLHPNAFSEGATTNSAVSKTQEAKAYDNEKSYGGIEISAVKQNKNETTFAVEGADKHLLKVDLKTPLAPNTETSVQINFSLTIPNCNHRFGYGQHTINLGNWYPVVSIFENGEWNTDGYIPSGDPFYTQIANYDVTLTYSSNLILASTGELQKTSTDENLTTSNYEALAVRLPWCFQKIFRF